MTIKTSGQLCISEIVAEFGGTSTDCLSEYYRGGTSVLNTWLNRNVPTSGQLCISDFYGSSSNGVTVIGNLTSVDEDTKEDHVNTITFTANNFNATNATFTIQGVGTLPINYQDFTTISLNGGTATNITSAADLSGTLPLTNGTGTITLTVREDFTLEGAETFTVTVTGGGLSATSATTTINDTSFASIIITDNQTDNLVLLNEEICFDISALGLPDGLYGYTLTPISGTLTYAQPTVTIGTISSTLFTSASDSLSVTFTNDADGIAELTATGGTFSDSTVSNGQVVTYTTPNTAGTYTITATVTDTGGNTVTDTHTVTVVANPTISISGVATPLNVGTSDAFTVTASAGSTISVASSDTGVATISNGTTATPTWNAVGGGSATITATASRTLAGTTRTASATASVVANVPVVSVTSNSQQIRASDYITAGGTLQINSGVWVWSDNTGVAALIVDVANATIINNGNIIGRGGNGGWGGDNRNSVGGFAGGPAINVTASGVTITNNSGAYIAGGGGGGGGGDNGPRNSGGGGGAGGGHGGSTVAGNHVGNGGGIGSSGGNGGGYGGGGAGGGAGGGGGPADYGKENASTGGGGGRILPGSGGVGGVNIRLGGDGGSAGAAGGNGRARAAAGGGGGWGASGGAGGDAGGAGGAAITGTSRTLNNSGTIYGST